MSTFCGLDAPAMEPVAEWTRLVFYSHGSVPWQYNVLEFEL